MDLKTGLLVLAFLVGCFALPTPEDDVDVSRFFDYSPEEASRIVGGSEAPFSRHRHMVALTNGAIVRSFFCGGSLISRRTILTAAHCISNVFRFGSLSSSLRATVGTNRWASGGATYTIQRNVTHPNYISQIIKNDVGVLITTSNVVLGNNVQTVPVTYSYIDQGVQSRVAGWGRIRANQPGSPVLLEIQTVTIGGNDCVARVFRAQSELNIRAPPVEPHIELCTTNPVGVGNCHGDSGSALTRIDNGQQTGVVSWGFPCALGAPDMFVRLSAYQSWLQNAIVN